MQSLAQYENSVTKELTKLIGESDAELFVSQSSDEIVSNFSKGTCAGVVAKNISNL